MIDELLPLTDYKSIVKAVAEHYGFSVIEIDSKYHITELGSWNSGGYIWKTLSEVEGWEGVVFDTELEAWKHAVNYALLNLF